MKSLKDIIESQNFLVNKKLKNRQKEYEYYPTSRYELKIIIDDLLSKGQTNLNCIDVSKITDMSWLFSDINMRLTIEDIDISEWNVSNVKDMSFMFKNCNKFKADLSKWDVSNVKWMISMFKQCSKFNSDLTNWSISNITDMKDMFLNCDTLKENNNIPKWYKGKV